MGRSDDRGLVSVDTGQPIVFAPASEPEITPPPPKSERCACDRCPNCGGKR